MAVNAYCIIADRPGNSPSKPDAVDILSFSFGASQTATYGTGSSGMESRAGRADLADVNILKVADKLTPLLFDDCVTGNILSKVEIIYDKPMGDQQEDYFKIEMEDVIITSIQLSGSAENPTESIAFAYEKIKVMYNPEDDEGNLQGFVEKGYDLSKLAPF
jgi:type VI secretion system secreted protein Hcp